MDYRNFNLEEINTTWYRHEWDGEYEMTIVHRPSMIIKRKIGRDQAKVKEELLIELDTALDIQKEA